MEVFMKEWKYWRPHQSWAFHWDPRLKMLSFLVIIFFVSMMQSPLMLSFVCTGAVLLCLSARFQLSYLFFRFLVVLPFLLLLSVPILFSNGWPVAQEKIIFTSVLVLKASSSFFLLLFLCFTQPFPKLMQSFYDLNIPPKILTIILLAAYYIYQLFFQLRTFRLALASRHFSFSGWRPSIRVYSSIMTGMIIKSFDQAEHVYRALTARGFNEDMSTGYESPRIPIKDGLISAVFISMTLVVVILDRWWFR